MNPAARGDRVEDRVGLSVLETEGGSEWVVDDDVAHEQFVEGLGDERGVIGFRDGEALDEVVLAGDQARVQLDVGRISGWSGGKIAPGRERDPEDRGSVLA